MLLRIVHPGGHVELHDRPVLAAEIMHRNPRCCVAYYMPAFQQPWAIVSPHTVLMLGHKFYVVPITTFRKLQALSPNHSPSSVHVFRNVQSRKKGKDDGLIPTCFFMSKENSRDEREKPAEISTDARKVNLNFKNNKGWFSDVNCFMCIEVNVNDLTKAKGTLSSNNGSCDHTYTLTRKKTRDLTGKGKWSGSPNPRRLWSSEHWQPSLESITEE